MRDFGEIFYCYKSNAFQIINISLSTYCLQCQETTMSNSSSSWVYYFKSQYEDDTLNDTEEVSNECIS